ncbi:ATP-binding protein [Nocardiopsis lambiniae]|uniref:ATP-binding protein n=1 Tax=Nocardiopsis lambiniae TaxID=3075539 RepID=A0ABU2ME58_9ACTN|nr:ATP-binding protein [Nocardiopsis sp. DSM 44743]MDT0330964.1 ATP-binding protein [Nocardiopsis sp. DSM 44743]
MTQNPRQTALVPTCSVRLPGTGENVVEARRFTVTTLRETEADVPEDVVDRAELLASGLATNAIRHTRSGDDGESFVVVVIAEPGLVRVTVRTGEPRDPARAPVVRHATPLAESGRGLALVDTLADEWGELPWPECGVFFQLTWTEDSRR